MKTLYIECNIGAAGDMLMGALLELHPDPNGFVVMMNSLGIPNVTIAAEPSIKCGITGTHIRVSVGDVEEHSHDHKHTDEQGHTHNRGTECHEHSHSHNDKHEHSHEHNHNHIHSDEHSHHQHVGMSDIESILNALPISKKAKADARAVYALIADAESKAHGKPVNAVHFHEIGMMDAVADIVGCCLLMEELAPEHIVVSAINVGSGNVKCSHGILPVPAPATATILKGVPSYGGHIAGELCTPTGAALLKHFANEFGDRPIMATSAIGYGMGKKDFAAANCVRVFLGETAGNFGEVVEIACNLDDMTGEELGFALETLMQSGALDVYITPIIMKKSRPGHMLVCLCEAQDEANMAALMLKYTTSFGVRVRQMRRYVLERSVETVSTKYGTVRVKAGRGFGVSKSKPEYDDVAALAVKNGVSLRDVQD